MWYENNQRFTHNLTYFGKEKVIIHLCRSVYVHVDMSYRDSKVTDSLIKVVKLL